nr:MAG TPA: hypothetical protein [Caudoviricetes sp.]
MVKNISKYCSVAAAIFFPTRVTIAFFVALLDIGADLIYSEYWVRLDESTSESDTSSICFLPVKGTLPQPYNRSTVANKVTIFFMHL